MLLLKIKTHYLLSGEIMWHFVDDNGCKHEREWCSSPSEMSDVSSQPPWWSFLGVDWLMPMPQAQQFASIGECLHCQRPQLVLLNCSIISYFLHILICAKAVVTNDWIHCSAVWGPSSNINQFLPTLVKEPPCPREREKLQFLVAQVKREYQVTILLNVCYTLFGKQCNNSGQRVDGSAIIWAVMSKLSGAIQIMIWTVWSHFLFQRTPEWALPEVAAPMETASAVAEWLLFLGWLGEDMNICFSHAYRI